MVTRRQAREASEAQTPARATGSGAGASGVMHEPVSAPPALQGFSRQQANEIAAVADSIMQPLRHSLSQVIGRLDGLDDRLAALETGSRGTERSLKALWQVMPSGDLDKSLESLRADVDALKAVDYESAIGRLVKQLAITGAEEPMVGAVTVVQDPGLVGSGLRTTTVPTPAPENAPTGEHEPTGNIQQAEMARDAVGQERGYPKVKTISDDKKPNGDKRKAKKGKGRRNGNGDDDPSSSSSDDDSQTGSDSDSITSESESSASEGSVRRDDRGGIFARKRRPAYKSLKELKPINRDYKSLLSYRQYRLKDRRQKSRSGDSNRKLKEFLRHRELARRGERFDGRDGITILHFLEKVVEDVELVGLSEAQALLAIRHCLAGTAKALFTSASGILPGGSGIRSWSEAVQYLLLTYATDSAIEAAIEAIQAMRQQANEDEKAFSARMTLAEQRCGNVHRWRERKLLFIDGLDGAIKPLVARFNRSSRKATYIELVEFALEEGNAHRARGASRRATNVLSPKATVRVARREPITARGNRQQAMLVDQEPSVGEWDIGSAEGLGDTEAHLLQPETGGTFSTPLSSYEPEDSTEPEAEDEPTLMMPRGGRVRPQGIQFADRRTQASRPGWIDRTTRRTPTGEGSRPGLGNALQATAGVFCYRCYYPGHVAPDCKLDVAQYAEMVVRNYESLPPRAQVPDASYWQAKATLANTQTADRRNNPPGVQTPPSAHEKLPTGEPPRQGEGRGPPYYQRRAGSPSSPRSPTGAH